jgi:hypothetical protein
MWGSGYSAWHTKASRVITCYQFRQSGWLKLAWGDWMIWVEKEREREGWVELSWVRWGDWLRDVCVCVCDMCVCIWCVCDVCLMWCTVIWCVTATRNQTEPRPSSKAPTSKHQTQMFASPPVTATPNQNRMPGWHQTQIFASPPVTATRYPERRLHTAPATRKPAAAQRSPRAQQLLQEALW